MRRLLKRKRKRRNLINPRKKDPRKRIKRRSKRKKRMIRMNLMTKSQRPRRPKQLKKRLPLRKPSRRRS